MSISSAVNQKHLLRHIPQGHGIHLAIADCSSLVGSHMLQAAQESPRVKSITCLSSKIIPLITTSDKVCCVLTPQENGCDSGSHSWANDIRENCTHLDAIVLLFDPSPQYGGIHNTMIKDSSLKPPSADNSGSIYQNDWAPIASIAEAAYDKGASVCVWATLLSDTNTRDVERMYDTKFTDVVMIHLSPQTTFVADDVLFVQGREHYWQTHVYTHLYRSPTLRWLTGCVLLSQVADAAIHWLLTSNSCLNKGAQSQHREHSSEEVNALAWSLEGL